MSQVAGDCLWQSMLGNDESRLAAVSLTAESPRVSSVSCRLLHSSAGTGWVLSADCIILDNTLVSTLRLVPATSRVSSDHAWMETPHTVTLPHITHHQTGTKIMNICRIGKPSSVYYSWFSFCETCFSNGSV